VGPPGGGIDVRHREVEGPGAGERVGNNDCGADRTHADAQSDDNRRENPSIDSNCDFTVHTLTIPFIVQFFIYLLPDLFLDHLHGTLSPFGEPPQTAFRNPVDGCGSVFGVLGFMAAPSVDGFITFDPRG
jgi:hypothetical protein